MHKRTAAAGTSRRLQGRKRAMALVSLLGFLFITATCIAFCLYAFNAISTLFTLIYAQASECLKGARRTMDGQRQRWMTNHRVLQPVKPHSRIHTWVHAHDCVCVCVLCTLCAHCFLLFCVFCYSPICLFVCLSRFCQRIYEWQRGFHLLWRPFCPFVRGRLPLFATWLHVPLFCSLCPSVVRCCSLCARCACLCNHFH